MPLSRGKAEIAWASPPCRLTTHRCDLSDAKNNRRRSLTRTVKKSIVRSREEPLVRGKIIRLVAVR